MSKVTKFEDLRCWQLARKLTAKAYRMTFEGPLAKDFDTRSQFRTAALSVMNNIAEGFGRYSDKDFVRFLDYAAASCTEVKSMTYLLLDLEYFSKERIESFQKEVEETKATTLALMKYLRNKGGKWFNEHFFINTKHFDTLIHQHPNTRRHQHLKNENHRTYRTSQRQNPLQF